MVGLRHGLSHKIHDSQPALPARHAEAMIAQSLWECPTNDLSNVRPTSCQRLHGGYCLGDKDLEAGWLRDLRQNKT